VSRDVHTSVHYWPNRFHPPQAAADFAKQLEAEPAVDWFQTWDQLVSFLPQALWTPDVAPMAEFATDSDSYFNAAMISMLAANATTELHITTTLDSVRIGPAELLQQMLTLAATTPARVALQLGAGELKQCKPFGYKRSQGLSRMEDILQIVRKLLTTEGLVSHEGKHWTYTDAWIGNHYPKVPEIWALGGGPKLIDIATSYADGFMSMAPSAFWEPEQWAAQVQEVRTELERKGRDSDAFVNGFWPLVVVYETEEERQQLFDSGIIKWMAAGWGRLHHGDWAKEGIDLVFPEDWHYAMRLLPHSMSRTEIESIISGVTPQMIEKSFFLGTPEEIADQIRPYIEAGADFVSIGDIAGAALGPEAQEPSLRRVFEVCNHIKGVPVPA
jgi:phthiodiolone/phenolphthiodiolone dimycocerosates ketoreductase